MSTTTAVVGGVAAKPLTPEEQARQQFLANDVLATGALPAAPKRDPEAHRGYITGVSLHRNDQKGTFSMKIGFHSTGNGKDSDYYLPLPRSFAANIAVDANTLSTGTPDPLNPGKLVPGSNERETYAMRIANSDGTGEAQRLRFIAAQNNRTLPQGMPAPTNIDEWVMVHNHLLANLPVIATFKADANPSEPQFANVLKLRGFFNEREVLANPKALKGYTRVGF